MTKKILFPSAFMIFLVLFSIPGCAQQSGLKSISVEDLEAHLSYLASDELEGRSTGEPGLILAAQYLADQASRIGLEPIDDNRDYYQEYTLVKRTQDHNSSSITISHGKESSIVINKPLYCLNPQSDTIDLSGELVFAGYGIYSARDNYNSFEGVDLQGKIVLIMNRGPMDISNDTSLLQNRNWQNHNTWRYKLAGLSMRMPKAVLIVMDPRSGYQSMDELEGRMIRYLSNSRFVKGSGDESVNMVPGIDSKIFFVHRAAADEMLRSSGQTLHQLQDSIDQTLTPLSFEIPQTSISIYSKFTRIEKLVPNVAGLIEGSDPELRKEAIVYSAHFDHLGLNDKGQIFYGADDNASGTAALIEIGEAFKKQQKDLKRSILILWISGEEIGLFGSKYYTDHPLIHLDQTVANINLDMIGTVRTERDTGLIYREKVGVLGMDSIGVIGGHQSADLLEIHMNTAEQMGMFSDFSMNSPDHPYRYYYRSDHFNFAKHNIPVLFYSTGIHVDYHKITDNYDRINFTKLKKVTELTFMVGYQLATQQERILVDNPYSEWNP